MQQFRNHKFSQKNTVTKVKPRRERKREADLHVQLRWNEGTGKA